MNEARLARVSVVIPAYNYAAYLRPCIESVLTQSLEPADVVVVDDASTDETPDVARSFGPPVTYIRHERNSGLSASRNTGIRNSSGDLITFLDADDLMKPDNLLVKSRRFAEHPSARIVFGNVDVIDASGEFLGVARRRERTRLLPQPELMSMLLRRNPFFASTAVVARNCFDAAGYFDETLHHAEDWDMWLRLAARFDGFYEDAPLIRLRTHATSMMKRNLKSHVDLDAMRAIVAKASERGDLTTAGTTFDRVYWSNYFRMLHNKVGRIPSRDVLKLYVAGIRRYPRRLVRGADLLLLGKTAGAAVLPPRALESVRMRWRRRTGELQ